MGGRFETEILQRADKYVVSLGGGGGGLRGTGASVQPANHGPCFVCCLIDLIRFTGFGSTQCVRAIERHLMIPSLSRALPIDLENIGVPQEWLFPSLFL